MFLTFSKKKSLRIFFVEPFSLPFPFTSLCYRSAVRLLKIQMKSNLLRVLLFDEVKNRAVRFSNHIFA